MRDTALHRYTAGIQRSGWLPLLSGPIQEQCLRVVTGIAEAIKDLPEERTRRLSSPGQSVLAEGPVGLALFYGYMEKVGFPGTSGQLEKFLDMSLNLASATPHLGLYRGLTGIGWTLSHIQSLVTPEEPEDPAADVDELLAELLAKSPWDGHYDLISGLVGLGVYALERISRPTGPQLLTLVVDRLYEMAESDETGITWRTPAPHVSPLVRSEFPAGLHDFGVAHGISGVIALLAEACAHGVAAEKARCLLEGAVPWLLDRQLPTESPGLFPATSAPGTRSTQPSRLAWCYGDAGNALSVLQAARCAKVPSWEEAALTIARHAAGRALADSRVVDAGLCHGSAGLGHLFNRLYQATGDAQLQEAAVNWFEVTLRLRTPGQGVHGYRAWISQSHWDDAPGFLGGAAGIGLALLAATSHVEPLWDRLLLASVAPRISTLEG